MVPVQSNQHHRPAVVSAAVLPENSVRISAGGSFAINPRKEPSVTIQDVFSAVDPQTGETRIFRFRNEAGEVFGPRLPFLMSRRHPYFQENLNAFRAYKLLYRPQMVIYDPEAEKAKELDHDALELDARNLIADYKKEGKTATLLDMLRRIEGPLADTTLDNVVLRLNRIAKATPAKLLDLQQDPDFEIKVLIDKAVSPEVNRLVLQEGRYYKMPNTDTLIADGIEALVLRVKTDPGFKAYLENAPLPSQVIVANTQSAPALPRTDSPLDILRTGQLQKDASQQPDGTTMEADEVLVSDERLKALIEAAMKANYFEKDRKGNYLLPGNTPIRTVDEAMAFYKPSPGEIKNLTESLQAFGISINE